MDGPFTSRAVRRLARELAGLQRAVRVLQGGASTAQARYSSLDGGVWIVKDDTGTVRQVTGTQPDGTVTTRDLNAPAPPAPAGFIVAPVPGGLRVTYSGAFEDGAARPSDLKWVEVHVDLDPAFTFSDATIDAVLVGRGSVTFRTDDYVPHTVRLVARNTSLKATPSTLSVTVTPGKVGPGDVAPGGIGTVELDDGAVTPAKSGTGVTSNLVPDPGFNDPGWRTKRAAAPWGFVEATAVGFGTGDWAAYCGPTLERAVLTVTNVAAGVPVSPGESYYVGYDAGRSAAGAGAFGLEVTFHDSTGAAVAPAEGQLDPLLVEWRQIGALPIAAFATRDGQVEVPLRAAAMRIVMVRDDVAGTSGGQLYLDRLEVRSVITKTTAGQRVETSPSGILVFGPDGQAIGSVNADGGLSMLTGQFGESLTYQGIEVAELLNQRARGEVARVDAGPGASPSTTGEIIWLEFEFDAEQGRAYKLRSSGLIARAVGVRGIQVRYTTNGNRPLVTSPVLIYNSVTVDQTLYLASDLGGLADGGDRRVRMVLCVRSWDGQNTYFDPSDTALGFSAWVEDVGPRQLASGGIVNGSTAGTGSTAPSTPTTTVKSYTTTWPSTWSQSWIVGNRRRSATSPPTMYQGYYDDVSGGDQAAIFGFDYPAISAALAGATIKKVEVYLYAEHWYYNAGGTVWLGTTPEANPPASYPATTTRRASWHLNKPEGRWVTVTNAIGTDFKSGAARSLLLDPRPTTRSLNEYGRFSGAGTASGRNPAIRITYEKAT